MHKLYEKHQEEVQYQKNMMLLESRARGKKKKPEHKYSISMWLAFSFLKSLKLKITSNHAHWLLSLRTETLLDAVDPLLICGVGLDIHCMVHRVDTQLPMAEMADLQPCTWKLLFSHFYYKSYPKHLLHFTALYWPPYSHCPIAISTHSPSSTDALPDFFTFNR